MFGWFSKTREKMQKRRDCMIYLAVAFRRETNDVEKVKYLTAASHLWPVVKGEIGTAALLEASGLTAIDDLTFKDAIKAGSRLMNISPELWEAVKNADKNAIVAYFNAHHPGEKPLE